MLMLWFRPLASGLRPAALQVMEVT